MTRAQFATTRAFGLGDRHAEVATPSGHEAQPGPLMFIGNSGGT